MNSNHVKAIASFFEFESHPLVKISSNVFMLGYVLLIISSVSTANGKAR